ncbi:MAG: hypothetical protein H7328_06610 [Bdellovibrio sp.]|nr:hypothetical protein [Bdellovibrio sp.]
MAVRCKTEIPAIEGLEANQMTVGRHVLINCEGDWDQSFNFTQAFIKLEENQKYVVKVLKAEARSVASFDVDFTFYQPGTYQFQEFILSDGTNEIQLGAQQFQLNSVVEKTADGKPPQPFGPLFPLTIPWPPIYAILLVALLVTGLVNLIYQLRRRARFKRLIDSLKTYDSSVGPDVQFYKTMRNLEKNSYPIDEMEKAFRLYALRVYQIPLFDLNNRQSLNFLRKRRPEIKKQRVVLQKFLGDFEELAIKASGPTAEERLHVAKRLYRFVDNQTVGPGS